MTRLEYLQRAKKRSKITDNKNNKDAALMMKPKKVEVRLCQQDYGLPKIIKK